MNFLKTLGSYVGSSTAIGGLPYTIDTHVNETEVSGGSSNIGFDLPDFQLFRGKAKADGQPVSIFKSKQPATLPTQNALRRIKTLRHPNILAYLDGTELPKGSILIVTEPVIPLSQYLEELHQQYSLESQEFIMSISLGLHSILLALHFINIDCKLIHGRLCPSSIFVTKGGDWKLGGFELTGEMTSSGPCSLYTSFEQYSDSLYKSPEAQRREWNTIAHMKISAMDMWSFGVVLYYIYNPYSKDITSGTNIPSSLINMYRQAIATDPRQRPDPNAWLTLEYLNTNFIKQMEFLENLAIKTAEEKVAFYKQLTMELTNIPSCIQMYKILPAFKAVVEFGVATTGKQMSVKLDPSESHMLPVMVQIGTLLPNEGFKQEVLPIIVKLFTCNDRAVRVQLLQMMDKFAIHFDTKLVNSTIVFDNLCSGFTDAAPILRELTVKSMLHIADKLSDSNLNTRLMKYFAKLQTDPEPAIRTNTTICLGRIAPKLNETTRPKVLFPAFSRALRDPFPHARLAGLRSLTACQEFFTIQSMAAQVVPVIAPLLLDISQSVREQAAISMDGFMKKVMAEAVLMKQREEEEAREQKRKQEEGENVPQEIQSGPSSGGYTSSLTSWATSAVVSNVGKMVRSGSSSTTSDMENSFGKQNTDLNSTPDDFGTDDDAWGHDDDLDDLSFSKQAPKSSRTSSGSMKLNSKPASVSLDFADAGGWGDDSWGQGEDEVADLLGENSSKTNLSMNLSNKSTSLQLGTSSSTTSKLDVSNRKSVSERLAEAKAKRDSQTSSSGGAMKLESKKGDEWDNWDF